MIPMKTKSLLLILLMLLVGCSKGSMPEDPDPSPVDPNKGLAFTLGSQEYNLPIPLQTLMEDGWEALDSLEGQIEGNTYLAHINLKKDKNLIIVSLFNPGKEAINKTDSLVAAISAENRTSVSGHEVPVDITLDNDITFMTPEEEIRDFYDDASISVEENSVYRSVIVTHSKLSRTQFDFYLDSKEMRWIHIEDYQVREAQ